MFNERKVAQMAAYFLAQEGGNMPILKLMKLLYLADRESLDRYEFPISGDYVVAMPHGPVLSTTLNYVDGMMESAEGGWETWISDRENHQVRLRQDVSRAALDELSDAELDVLEAVWGRFGPMGKWAIRDYTHEHCPEWKDPAGTSKPISYREIFKALGRNDQQAGLLADRLEQENNLHRIFAGS